MTRFVVFEQEELVMMQNNEPVVFPEEDGF